MQQLTDREPSPLVRHQFDCQFFLLILLASIEKFEVVSKSAEPASAVFPAQPSTG